MTVISIQVIEPKKKEWVLTVDGKIITLQRSLLKAC